MRLHLLVRAGRDVHRECIWHLAATAAPEAMASTFMDSWCCLTFELSGPTPEWCLAREANDDSERLAGQVPGRWRSAPAKG